MNIYAEKALQEYNSETASSHQGGINGRPFWNKQSTQFMFVPSFDFPNIRGAKAFLFTAL